MQRSFPTDSKSKNLAPISPFCFRLPKAGEVDPYFGGTRSFWSERVLPSLRNNFMPPIKSFVVKKHPNAKTGIRFIDFKSAAAWFEAQATTTPPSDGTSSMAA